MYALFHLRYDLDRNQFLLCIVMNYLPGIQCFYSNAQCIHGYNLIKIRSLNWAGQRSDFNKIEHVHMYASSHKFWIIEIKYTWITKPEWKMYPCEWKLGHETRGLWNSLFLLYLRSLPSLYLLQTFPLFTFELFPSRFSLLSLLWASLSSYNQR